MSTLVVVGASLAGLRGVEAVRRDGFDGDVVLVGAEEHLPYDRPPLSKAYLADDEPDEPHYRSESSFADELAVETVLGTPASGLDTGARVVTVGDREIPYDGLVIATGAHARTLPGTDPAMGGVFTVRTLDDSRALRTALRAGARKLVVVGAGFIGSEVASVGRGLGLDVTLVEAAATPLVHAIGEQMGAACTALHHRHGTTVLTGAGVERVLGDDHVTGVELTDGTRLEADVLVVGVGAAPATAWLEGSGLTLDDGVVCDTMLRAADGVYAAGDVARWENPLFGERMRLEHWTSAAAQGATAARNAVDPAAAKAYTTVPYFWSDWYASRIQFVGLPAGDEVVVVGGELDEQRFTALYRRGDALAGALAVDMSAEVMKYRRLLTQGSSWDDALEFARDRREKATT